MMTREIRTGLGMDFHKFADPFVGPDGKSIEHLIKLGGVDVQHDREIVAHSDGDLLVHAVVDALLGALSKGDIGTYFPPSEEKWKDCDSMVFLRHSVDLLKEVNGKVLNLDATVICERPKVLPYFADIQRSLSSTLGVERFRVNMKGKTTEKMGFLGRKEGIAAMASVLIEVDV